MLKSFLIVFFSSLIYAHSSLTQIIDIKDNKTIVSLNFDSIQKDLEFSLDINAGINIVFNISKYEQREDGFKLIANNSTNNSTLILTSKNKKVFGNIIYNDEKYSISPYGNNLYQIIKNEKERIIEIDSHGKKNPNTKKAYFDSNLKLNNSILKTSNLNEITTIDVLILYTQEMRNYYGESLEALLQNNIDIGNEVLENSNINARLNLVKIVLYQNSLASETYTIETALNQINNDLDVKALKRLYNIDTISLFRHYNGHGSCGLGYLLNDTNIFSAKNSFSVVEIKDISEGGYYCSDTTFIHELGHNFGCDHDRNHSTLDGLFSYSYGYDIPYQFATIMSYDYPTINYFSNPNIRYNGNYIGIPEGFTNSADCARTIRETKSLIANHNLNEYLENTDFSNNNQIIGKLSDENDRDSFSFFLSGSLTFTFNLNGYYINIYDKHQHLVYSSDRNFSLNFTGANYYIVVSSFDDNSDYYYTNSQYDYNLKIDGLSSNCWDAKNLASARIHTWPPDA